MISKGLKVDEKTDKEGQAQEMLNLAFAIATNGTKENIPHLVLHHIPRIFNSGAIMRHELSRILHSLSYTLTING